MLMICAVMVFCAGLLVGCVDRVIIKDNNLRRTTDIYSPVPKYSSSEAQLVSAEKRSSGTAQIVDGKLNGKKVKPAKKAGVVSQAGWVPIDFENPNQLEGKIILFEGTAPVNIIPDASTGGWKYSRPAFAQFPIKRGWGSNWYGYTTIILPRKTYFRYAFQAQTGDWVMGGSEWTAPKFGSFRTGDHPTARQYTRTVPTRVSVDTGGVARLPYIDRSTGPLHIEVTWDARGYGAAIANAITDSTFESRKYRR